MMQMYLESIHINTNMCLLWLFKCGELFAPLLCNVEIKHFDKMNSILK